MIEYGGYVDLPEFPEWLYLEPDGKGQDPRQKEAMGQYYENGYWSISGQYLFHKPDDFSELAYRVFIDKEDTKFHWKFLDVEFNTEIDPSVYLMEDIL